MDIRLNLLKEISYGNFSIKRMDLYILRKDVDLSEWDNAINDYENERSKWGEFDP